MMKRVAISQRVAVNAGYAERRDCLAQDWAPFLSRLGLAALAVPNSLDDPAAFVAAWPIDAIILSGGNTVGLAGESPPPADVHLDRDATETALLHHAVAHGLPVLGICRGMQMINRFFGGGVTRGVTALGYGGHVGAPHTVHWLPEDRMVWVNSFHDDGVTPKDKAAILNVLAVSEDGLIEALCHPTLPIVGIQWHPERPGPDDGFSLKLVSQVLGLEKTPCA